MNVAELRCMALTTTCKFRPEEEIHCHTPEQCHTPPMQPPSSHSNLTHQMQRPLSIVRIAPSPFPFQHHHRGNAICTHGSTRGPAPDLAHRTATQPSTLPQPRSHARRQHVTQGGSTSRRGCPSASRLVAYQIRLCWQEWL